MILNLVGLTGFATVAAGNPGCGLNRLGIGMLNALLLLNQFQESWAVIFAVLM